jgi:hypothetical protein
MSHRSRFASDVRINAPLRVPTNTRTPLMPCSFLSFVLVYAQSSFTTSDVIPPANIASTTINATNSRVMANA